MTKNKSTKRALLSSILSLALCMTMLIGTTFAWFTDNVTSANYIIKSGNLDIEMYWADGKENPENATWEDASEGSIFNYTLWEPGYTEVRHIKIANAGTLALKYQLNISANGEVSKLADVIDVYYVDPAKQVENRDALEGVTKLGTLSEILKNINTTASGSLQAGENHTVTLALKMQENAGNEYQNLSIGSDFSIQLFATQFTYEKDSFGNNYDKYASVTSVTDMKAALAEGVTEFNFMGADINLNYGLTKTMVPAGKTITIANAEVNGRSYGNGVDGTIIFENCTFTNTGAYSIHFDNGSGDVIFKNCALYGWNSFGSTLNSVSFYDSYLYGNGKYALIRSYVNLYLENCVIDTSNADHTDLYSEGVEAVSGATLEMVNCSKAVVSAEGFLAATEGGNIVLNEDINYNNTDPDKQMILESTSEISFDGNDATITLEGADPSIGNHSYLGFVPPAGEDVSVSDLTVTGTGFVELGHYGIGGGDYEANNLVLKDMVATVPVTDGTYRVSPAFCHYGNAVLNNCSMTGATTVDSTATAYDAGFINGTNTVINGGKYGKIYLWSQAHVTVDKAEIDVIDTRAITAKNLGMLTIKAGSHVGTINIICSDKYTPALTIEDGAIVDTIIYKGVSYTQNEWLNR